MSHSGGRALHRRACCAGRPTASHAAPSLQDQISRLRTLDEQIARIEQRILEWRRNDDACRRISEIPGVGVLTATAAVPVIGQAKTFRSGREFAAYLGLVPRQNGSGGKVKLGGISKLV